MTSPEAKAAMLGTTAVLSGVAAAFTRGWSQGAAVALAAGATGALVAHVQGVVAPRAGDLGGKNTGAASSFVIANTLGKAIKGVDGGFAVHVSPALAPKAERDLRNAASRIDPEAFIYRQPGQGIEPTRFVVANRPLNLTGARLVYGGVAVAAPAPVAQAQLMHRGAGGWGYARSPGGDIVVTADPRPGQPMVGKTVPRGSTAWKAIDTELRAAGR